MIELTQEEKQDRRSEQIISAWEELGKTHEMAFHVAIGRINEERIRKGLCRIDTTKNHEVFSSFVNDLIYTLKYRVTTGDNLSQIFRLTEIL